MPRPHPAPPELRVVADGAPAAPTARRPVVIAEDDVAAALRLLRRPTALAGHPLCALRALHPLLPPDAADDPTARARALAELLRALVADALGRHRGGAHDDGAAPAADEAALFDDFAAGDVEREAFSVLYHRFAAPSRWPAQRIERVGACSRRTVLRRLNLGVALVSDRLRALERAAGGGPALPADALADAWRDAVGGGARDGADDGGPGAASRFGLRALAASMLLDQLERALGDAWRPDGLP